MHKNSLNISCISHKVVLTSMILNKSVVLIIEINMLKEMTQKTNGIPYAI